MTEKPRLSFRLKLTLLAVTAALLPVAIVGLISIEVNKTALTEANKELLFSVLHHISRHVEEEIHRDQDELSIASAALLDTSQPLEQRLSILKSVVGGGRLNAIGIYDDKGLWVDTVEVENSDSEFRSPMPALISSEQIALLNTSDVAVGPAEIDQANGHFVASIFARARGPNGSWFLVSRLDLARIQAELETVGHERLGPGHSLLMVNTELQVLADSQIEQRGQTLSTGRGILAGVAPSALDEGILLFGESSVDGTSTLGSVRSMEEVPWAVIAEIPRDVAYFSVHRIRLIVWIVIALAGTCALLIGVFMARRISAPLLTLVSFAGDLANRRFDRRVEVHSGDELGVLGRALSSAAIELEISDERIRKEEKIRSDLGRYLPGALVNNIVSEKQKLSLGGDRCTITVLFADIVGFTPLSESHAAEEVVELLNEFFTILTEIIFRHEGTVDKFIGDSVMAFWGAPNPQSDHAERALLAAQDMQRWLEIGNAGWMQKYGVEIKLAIGVNTGEAVVGNFGSSERMEYTAIGDCVNVAARLETIARPQQILITEATRAAAGDDFEYAPLGSRKVVGRQVPLDLFEVIV